MASRVRLKKKSKEKKKRRLRWAFIKVIFLVILGVLSWGTWEYTKPEKFPIKRVKIFATYRHVDKKLLQETVSSYLSGGFFYLNVFGLKKKLLDFPWIYAVSVKRQWPDTVLVNIAEERAILQWGNNALVNSFGNIFYPSKLTFPKNLPVIFGPENEEAKIFDLYKKMGYKFEPLDLSIKKLLLSPRHYWEVLLSNGAMVYLKENDPLGQVELLVNLYRKITAKRSKLPISFDMRYQSGLAVKWE